MLKELIIQYRSFFTYAVFGVLTTCVNIITFGIVSKLGVSTFYANALAWLFAILFAYVTNRLWVFGSDNHTKEEIIKEFLTFIVCRLATGVLDQTIMVVGVDYIGAKYIPEIYLFTYSMLLKVISNGFVIIFNYLFSKLVIFKKKRIERV